MRVIGIISEFNPFHNGHEYLFKKAKEAVGDKRALVMAVMSGPFTQRGLPAILPKHQRAEQALRCGADLVIELPFTYACAPSERFASGAVELLYRTGVVTDIAFGVDCENPAILTKLAFFDYESSKIYTSTLKEKLAEGASFPSARAGAIIEYLKSSGELSEVPEDAIRQSLRRPNSILALDYMHAMDRLGAHFKLHMIPRVGAAYSDSGEDVLEGEYPSATSIRDALFDIRKEHSGELSVAAATMQLAGKLPDKSLAVALAAWQSGKSKLPDLDAYTRDIINRVSTTPEAVMDECAYMGDGLSGYLRNQISDLRSGEYDYDRFMSRLNTRHFTMPRIWRALASLMVGQTEEFIHANSHPRFIRVLGFGKDGRYCLKIMGKCARLPILHNCSDAAELYSSNIELRDQFELNINADNVAASYLGLPHNSDRETPPVKV